MNKFSTLAAAAALVLAACGEAPAPEATPAPAATEQAEVTPAKAALVDGDYTVDAAGSEIVWIGRKITGEHRGNISLASGNFRVTDGQVAGATFVMDMTSMTNTDLDEENGGNLLGHLASDDFFSIATYPTATFQATTFAPTANGYIAKGNLTIKGITKPQEVEVTLETAENGAAMRGMMKIDRTAFDIKYGSGSFFSDLGDKAIDDNFELGFFIRATK
jgi:polyisoprenoid-binding protein YceI